MRLTKLTIDHARYQAAPGRRDVRWDDEVKGFGLRVYPSGQKSFIVTYRVQGRKRLMTLGNYGVLTLPQARDMARLRLGEVISGGDPLANRKRENQANDFASLCQLFIERHAKLHKKTWKEDEGRIARLLIPAWGTLKAQSITRTDVGALHARIGKTAPYEANKTLALLSKMFELARQWGVIDEMAPNPARNIGKFREKKRDRWVSPIELPALAKAIAAEPNIYVKAALWLYLLTGVRKSELLMSKWGDLDFQAGQLRLGDTKAGRIHYVPLSEPAIAILKQLPQQKGNQHIFPGRRGGQPLVNVSKPWSRIRKAAGVEDVRLHDLRRTVGSWLAQSGNSLHLVGRVLNHSNTSTTAIYAKFGEDHVKSALESHGSKLVAATKLGNLLGEINA